MIEVLSLGHKTSVHTFKTMRKLRYTIVLVIPIRVDACVCDWENSLNVENCVGHESIERFGGDDRVELNGTRNKLSGRGM